MGRALLRQATVRPRLNERPVARAIERCQARVARASRLRSGRFGRGLVCVGISPSATPLIRAHRRCIGGVPVTFAPKPSSIWHCGHRSDASRRIDRHAGWPHEPRHGPAGSPGVAIVRISIARYLHEKNESWRAGFSVPRLKAAPIQGTSPWVIGRIARGGRFSPIERYHFIPRGAKNSQRAQIGVFPATIPLRRGGTVRPSFILQGANLRLTLTEPTATPNTGFSKEPRIPANRAGRLNQQALRAPSAGR